MSNNKNADYNKHTDMGKIAQIVVISAEIDLPEEYDLLFENEYQLLLEKAHVSEEIYKFAERIQGAIVEIGAHNYMIFSTKSMVEVETDQLKELSILDAVRKHTAHTLSVGIGLGITAREAKYNASIGLNKALTNKGDKAYIVNNGEVFGPICGGKAVEKQEALIIDTKLQNISKVTGISVNNIYKLHCVKEKMKKDYFTSRELSIEFGNTHRSMNRMIEKLENNGYIEVVGNKIITGAGRPSRILRILF